MTARLEPPFMHVSIRYPWSSLILVALLLRGFLPLSAQEGNDAPRDVEPPPRRADAYKPLGPNLFPVYEHYLRTADNTEVRNILYLYTSTYDRDSGSWSRHLYPFFYVTRELPAPGEDKPPSSSLGLYPLLYFSREGADESFHYSLPLYYDRTTPESFFRLLVPLWLQTEKNDVRRYHVLPPLFRHSRSRQDPELPVDSWRFGIWKVLEFWESRFEPDRTSHTALNLFNWKEETRSGLALYKYDWRRDEDRLYGNTRLFPLYWHSREPGAFAHAIIPFYAFTRGSEGTDFYLPFLLSRLGGGTGAGRRYDFLWPLFHHSHDKESSHTYSFPLFLYGKNSDGGHELCLFPFHRNTTDIPENMWRALLIPYNTSYQSTTGKRTHSILYPLSYFSNEPDGSGGSNWFFPYIETYNRERLLRFFLPLYVEYQALAGGETDWFFRTGIPLYWSWGYVEDYFSMGIPLYWASRTGPRGWRVFFPFYFHLYRASSWSTHVPPLFSYLSYPSRKQLFILGPLFIHETFYDIRGDRTGSGVDFLWPLISVENRDDGHVYRLMPLFSTSRTGDTRTLFLTPLYYTVDSPRGRHRYFFPFYGHYEHDRITRDFYALGSWAHTTERDQEDRVFRTRDDVLWSLISHQQNTRAEATHTRILPLAFWKTNTPVEDRTVAGPFYYSHRIIDGDETHRLHLVLGNLFFSKTVEQSVRPVNVPVQSDTPGEAGASRIKEQDQDAEANAPPAVPEGKAAPESPPRSDGSPGESASLFPLAQGRSASRRLRDRPVRETSREQGVLWPLSRWYRDDDGNRGRWVFPFYFESESDVSRKFALFPLHYRQTDVGRYDLSFFRYLFLTNWETWRGGYRWTLAQILADWKSEESTGSRRLRLLYPLFEFSWDREGYEADITPLCRFSARGETSKNYIFPLYWQGKTTRSAAGGEEVVDDSHFFLLPLYGHHYRRTRSDYFFLFPFFHLRTSLDALKFELWPFFFWRDEPGLKAARLWPLHADETGLRAGEFWVSRFLYLSKRFEKENSYSYRLDPFLFRMSRGPQEAGFGTLFEMLAYDRRGDDASFRFIPFAFGSRTGRKSWFGAFPFYYGRDYGEDKIDYGNLWRFAFPVHQLRGGDGERHTTVIWKLFELTRNPNRPLFRTTGLLFRLYFRRATETSTSLYVNPLFYYYRNDVDDETQYSFLLSLYNYRRVMGKTTHTLFYFIRF